MARQQRKWEWRNDESIYIEYIKYLQLRLPISSAGEYMLKKKMPRHRTSLVMELLFKNLFTRLSHS